MRRSLLALTLVIASAGSAAAQTLTTRDVIELSKAGLSEPVLLALIEVNRSVFPIDRDTLKTLKDAGVAPNVIVAMLRSGRDVPVVPQPEPQLQPQAAIVVHHDDRDGTSRERELERELDRARERQLELEIERARADRRAAQYVVPVAVPVYVPVPVRRREPSKPLEPVYWGWDGKLRPDAWKPEPPKHPRGPGGHDKQ
jgi:hypothetical protein